MKHKNEMKQEYISKIKTRIREMKDNINELQKLLEDDLRLDRTFNKWYKQTYPEHAERIERLEYARNMLKY